MPVLQSNEIFFTAFEPKQKNRFIMIVEGMQSYQIKGVGGVNLSQEAIALNHINVQRFVKGKTTWGPISMTLFDPITPSGAQSVMEWVRLHHESVTGRDGYSDFYKKDLTMNILGPVGDVVSEWIIKGALITSANFGDYNWDDDSAAQEIELEVQPDYCILNF
jgi:hypothetical protein|tara:strand:+ start:2629 stop:3117 length:489 start_codon:yes stop_codon:yes gene_type:complete